MDASTKNLLFLLSLAPMSLGACGGTSGPDDAGDDGTSTGDGDGDGDPTTGDGDGDPTTGDGDGDPTTGDGDGDPTTGDGDGDGDPTTGDGDGDGNDVCTAYADFNGMCYGARYVAGAYDYCVTAIAAYTAEYGPECGAAYEAYMACISTLTCEEFMTEEPCLEATMAISDICFK